MNAKDRIIVALDVDSYEKAESLVDMLRDEVGAFKVGLELFNKTGPEIFQKLKNLGADKIFYDAKFMDIPNTVAGAMNTAVQNGVWMINVHCLGGIEMMKRAKESAVKTSESLGIPCPLVIGVTILTSIDQPTLNNELRICGAMGDQVMHLAECAKIAGLDGVVASPHEISLIRKTCCENFIVVTPGVRPAGSDVADQKRIKTPAESIQLGSDFLVIGRPIIADENPVESARNIAKEIESVL
ncbi:MAG: orotidine-5'-phosphate decarboxylase [Armatimonadota bacterium]